MKISVILAHPDNQSFNHAIALTAVAPLKENGHEIFFMIYPLSLFGVDFKKIHDTNGTMCQIILNLTNESWYGGTLEPLPYFDNASFRSIIEHRRALVRSTNTVISAIIDPVGRLGKRSGQWTQEIFSGNVPMMTGRTIYSYGGNWLGVITLLISIITIGLSFISKHRKV